MRSVLKNLILFVLVGFATWWAWNWINRPRHSNLLNTSIVHEIQHYDQDLQGEIDELWERIEAGLKKHCDKPIDLGPPVTDAELERIEFELGYRLPGDLKASMRVHLRTGEFLSSYCFYDAGQITGTHQMYFDCASGYCPFPIAPDPDDCEPFWHPGWIPIAGWDAFELVVNLETGEVFSWQDPGLRFASESWKSWLTNVANRLELQTIPKGDYSGDGFEYWIDGAFSTPGSDKEW